MIKILRVFIGTLLGVYIAQYFLPGFDVSGVSAYLFGALIVMGSVFVLKGLNF